MESLRRAAGGRGGWARALGLALGLACTSAPAALPASAAAAPGSEEEIPLPDLTGSGSAEEEAAQDSAPAPVAVLAPRVDPIFAPLQEGMREWLSERASFAGLEVADRASVEAALAAEAAAGRPVHHGADAPALAARLGADRVLLSELHFERGQVDLRLHLHAGSDGRVLVGAQARGRVSELSSLAQRALVDAFERLGLATPAFASAAPPQLSDWSALSRARERLEAGDLAAAWREVSRLEGPAAARLRLEIDARAQAPGATPAMRSRLANASGRPDPEWLRVRESLRDGVDRETLLAAGDAAVAREDAETAARLFARAAEIDPGSAEARLATGRALAALGREDEAAVAFRGAVELAPGDPAPHVALAENASVPARERAEHLLRAGELETGRFETEEAKARFEEAGRLDGSLLATAHRNVAGLSERIGNDGDALLAYEQSVELGATEAPVLAGLGRARAAGGDREGAVAAFRDALGKDPESAEALGGLGQVLAEEGRAEEALPHLERAVALAPGDVSLRRALARVEAERGDAQGALALLETDGLPAGVSEHARAGLLLDAAEIRRSAGDLAGAEVALDAAVALEPDDPPLRTALAGLYEAKGDTARAEAERALLSDLTAGRGVADASAPASAAQPVAPEPARSPSSEAYATFDALAASFPTEAPADGKQLRRVLLLGTTESLDRTGQVRRWLRPRRPDVEAIDLALLVAAVERFPIEETPPVPPDVAPLVEQLLAFSTDRTAIAAVNALFGVDAVFVAQLVDDRRPEDPLWAAERPLLEVRLLGGTESDGVFILANQLRLEGEAGIWRWNARAAVPWTLLLALVAWPFVRGWGSVVVKLDYDTKATRGFFHVRLSRRPGKASSAREKEGQSNLKRYQGKVRVWSRFARAMADSETRFRLVPARVWYVNVHGLLTDAKSKEVIGSYLEERQIRVERGQAQLATFNLRPEQAPIEVRLTRGGEAVQDASRQGAVALRGAPETLRYLRGGTALLHVGNGTHRVVLGLEERVFEQEVTVANLTGASACFAADRDDLAVFTGCPDAVEPYLLGDLPTASQALDRVGQTELASLLRAEYHKERGENEKAARYYEAAGRVQEAAELVAESEDAQHSATLFEQAGDFGRAAERYRESGDFERAAAAFESAFDYDAAIDCYRRARAPEKVMELLERTGRSFEAAQAALQAGDGDRAIRNLQQVDLRDPDYGEACRTLGTLFAERGDLDLAVAKLADAIATSGDEDSAQLELLEQYGDTLERAGETERALEVFEAIRKRDYTYGGVAQRLETLRDLRRNQQQSVGTATRVHPTAAAPAAPAEGRYELLGELGRGGMGVVYQARDRRLGRVVALKRLPDNLRENPTAVQLFLREARAAAALNHPNIVTLFDADQEEGNYYLTMEFLDGLPLDQILKKRGKLSMRDCARLGQQIATGLQFAHERHIVHRDVKTSNLFFTKDRVVKIMDFGLAKMMQEVRRAATVIGGTPYYMAPEQATGENVDHRADLYALGVTLFELATGTLPFREGDVTWHHRNTPPPDPRSAAPELPVAFAELVLQLLSKDPAARPASAAEVGERLGEIGRSLG